MVKIAELSTNTINIRKESIIGIHQNKSVVVGLNQRPTYRSYGVAYRDENNHASGSVVTLSVRDQTPPKAQVSPASGRSIDNLKGSASLRETNRILKSHKIPRKLRKEIISGMKDMLQTKDWLDDDTSTTA